MTLTILGSESLGNCYLLQSADEVIIIEAGIRCDILKQALDYNFTNVVGCLVSHGHGDHAKYAKEYAKNGIDIYSSIDTIRMLNLDGYRFNRFKEEMFMLGSFVIFPFQVPHGVTCHGFLINHIESGKILFVTDASHIPHKFNSLTHICIEANYSDAAMVNTRAMGHHMALDTALSFIADNDPHKVRNIILLHLSATNSDERQFVTAVKSIAPHADVHIADTGVVVNLNKHPF